MTSILEYVPPGIKLRPEQRRILLQVEEHWLGSDVLVIPGKVGIGKSIIAMTIAAWRSAREEKVGVITPRVALQDQYAHTFPEVPVLKGKSRYSCSDGYDNCGDKFEVESAYCPSCPFAAVKKKIKTSPVAVFNLNSYFFNKDIRKVAIFDEAHLIHEFLSDQFTTKIWQHKDNYPDGLKHAGDIALWLEGRLEQIYNKIDAYKKNGMKVEAAALSRTLTRYTRIRHGLSTKPANFFIEEAEEDYFGKSKPLLRIRPASLLGLPEILWPAKITEKVVLLSGTISPVELRRLGLRDRRIKWIKCKNPISADRRPVDASWGVNMSYGFQDKNIPALCQRIEYLASTNESNGLVHTTYGIAHKMKQYLTDDRYLWHTKDNKEEVLEEFKRSEGKILIASGMSEGIDLAGKQFGWQVITKIMWPSKADMLIEKWYQEDIEWIKWLTVRTLLQQTGRITRGEEDYGVTHILDLNFGRPGRKGLWKSAGNYIPTDYKESIKWE